MRSPTSQCQIRLGLLTATLLAVCTTASCGDRPQPPPAEPAQAAPAPAPAPPPPPAPEAVRANELGDVPVLMYHRITRSPGSVYDRTPEDFRAELERPAAEGYVPVTATEYATGRIDIPAGRHPVVLTFDDGSTSQFTMDSSGRPAPDTAVRILMDVARAHPAFRPTATFYVFEPPFEEAGGRSTLTWLHRNGFEIGNHTLDHPNLGSVPDAEAQRQIAEMQRVITDAVPAASVRSLALPFGAHPDLEELAAEGSAEGITYHHDSVMLVGSNPAPSPWSADFDPENIPRIRSQGHDGEDANYGSTAWLDLLTAQPDRRYTSDGDPGRISVPATSTERPGAAVGDRLYQY